MTDRVTRLLHQRRQDRESTFETSRWVFDVADGMFHDGPVSRFEVT